MVSVKQGREETTLDSLVGSVLLEMGHSPRCLTGGGCILRWARLLALHCRVQCGVLHGCGATVRLLLRSLHRSSPSSGAVIEDDLVTPVNCDLLP